MIRLIISLLLFGFSWAAKAQLPRDVYPLNREFKKGGFFISPQLTYTLAGNEDGTTVFGDSTYQFENTGSGKMGFGLEAGWFHSFKQSYFIQLLEGAIAYRTFKGSVDHEGRLNTTDSSTQSFRSNNEFDAQFIVASLRAKNIRQLGKHSFLSLGLGANFNYLLSDDVERSATYPFSGREESAASNSLQLHFQVGVGFRISRKILIVPSLETPILGVEDFSEIQTPFPYFNTNFQPLIFSLKIQFLREDPEHCNAPSYDGPSDKTGFQ